MKISGFSFVRNAIKFDYPIEESIRSILPICDEFIVALGNSEDRTYDLIQSIQSPKIRIKKTIWDDSLRTGGKILAQQTNIALKEITGDWGIYLQADEVIHERFLNTVRLAMQENLNNQQVEGLLFGYKHFYGGYQYVANSRKWYRHEIRIIRNGIKVESWGDAQGFRIGGRKLKVKLIDAQIYHYGWVKPPSVQQEKQKYFNKLWHPDKWITEIIGTAKFYDYHQIDSIEEFHGNHPSVMKERISSSKWIFNHTHKKRITMKDKILKKIEAWTHFRIGEYKNYTLLKN